tara:strand:- start:432 stop:695 length:264 start_codon:yes stop_codon:yes gene_type:complete
MSEVKTPAGKVIETFVDPITAHLKVRFADGGVLPEELSGMFTSKALADIAIQMYLLKNETKQTKAVEKKEERKKFVKDMVETLSEED